MTNESTFPNIDISYWHLNDKAWLQQRKSDWPRIEKMLSMLKSKKATSVIKQYYLKGKLPDWHKWAESNNHERHLDIFLFLWCHPSRDENLLKKLRDEYLCSGLIKLEDVERGYETYFYSSLAGAVVDCTDKAVTEEFISECFRTDCENELFFEVLLGRLDKAEYVLNCIYLYGGRKTEERTFKVPKGDISALITMGRWLCLKQLSPINEDFLYQYSQPLEKWFSSFPKEDDYFSRQLQERMVRENYNKSLYQIHHFDTEKEGDTCRTRFVHKMRKMLDERELFPEFKQMWLDVKAGKIEVEKPWGR